MPFAAILPSMVFSSIRSPTPSSISSTARPICKTVSSKRFIGDPAQRFAEDHLRLLRAVRCAARFDLTIEPTTAAAIMRNAPALIRISPERIADELRMTLTSPARVAAWRLLWRFDLPAIILRDLKERPENNDPQSLFPQLASDSEIPFGLALAAFVLDYRMRARPNEPVLTLLDDLHARQSVRVCRKDFENQQ